MKQKFDLLLRLRLCIFLWVAVFFLTCLSKSEERLPKRPETGETPFHYRDFWKEKERVYQVLVEYRGRDSFEELELLFVLEDGEGFLIPRPDSRNAEYRCLWKKPEESCQFQIRGLNRKPFRPIVLVSVLKTRSGKKEYGKRQSALKRTGDF